MLAPRNIPADFTKWNSIHGAPFGFSLDLPRWKRSLLSKEQLEKKRGIFANQGNNTIRQFEYPWAYAAAALQPGMQVLEIGGGLAGFQFALDRFGCKVVNVDPGMEKLDWPCNLESMQELNRRFNTKVELRNTTIDKAGIQANHFDRVFSISVIEHLPQKELANVMRNVHECLKPDGLFILTVDLFLNLAPFSSRQTNDYGQNQNVRAIAEMGKWELVSGDRKHLYGYPEFRTDDIISNLEQFLLGQYYPALAQCLVLRKA